MIVKGLPRTCIEEMPAPPTMIFPIIQHIGAPSEIVVKKATM